MQQKNSRIGCLQAQEAQPSYPTMFICCCWISPRQFWSSRLALLRKATEGPGRSQRSSVQSGCVCVSQWAEWRALFHCVVDFVCAYVTEWVCVRCLKTSFYIFISTISVLAMDIWGQERCALGKFLSSFWRLHHFTFARHVMHNSKEIAGFKRFVSSSNGAAGTIHPSSSQTFAINGWQ